MYLTEPSTTASDLLLGIVGLISAQRLFRISVPARRGATRMWGGALLAMSLAALLGAVHHAVLGQVSPAADRALWTTVLWMVGVGSVFMLAASARATLGGAMRRIITAIAWLEFAVYVWWILGHPVFEYVILDYGSAMVMVLVIQAWGSYRRREASASWITGGVLVSFLAAGIEMYGSDPWPYFNHNDMFHLVQIVGVLLFYQGARRIRAR